MSPVTEGKKEEMREVTYRRIVALIGRGEHVAHSKTEHNAYLIAATQEVTKNILT